MPKGIAREKSPSVGMVIALEVKDELLDAVREAVASGKDGVTFGEAADLLGLSLHYTRSAIHELVAMGVVEIADRIERPAHYITLPGWTPPEKPGLTERQRSALDYLVSVSDDDGIAYTSYRDIAAGGTVPHGGIIATLDSLDCKGYLSFLLRGKGARRTLFKVYPEGNGPQEYSPFGHGMIGAPAHLGIPMPPGFAAWAAGKMIADAMATYERCAPVVRRWFVEAGVTPVAPPRVDRRVPCPVGFARWARGKSVLDACAFYNRSALVIRRWFAESGATPTHKQPERAAVMAYPFIARDRGTPEHELLKRVNDAVPAWIPPDRRADICQDLMVGILCGDISEDTLALSAKIYVKDVLGQFPLSRGDLSLDDTIGDTDIRIMDTIAAEPTHWDYA